MGRLFTLIGLLLLGILTAVTLLVDGLAGFPAAILFNYASAQIYFDLVIAILMINVWIWHDAHANGRNPWPWMIAALIVGSFAPLVYLLTRSTRADA